MFRRALGSGDVLLVVLRLLEQKPTDVRQLLGEIDRTLGSEARVSAGDVLLALDALEAEALIEIAALDGLDAYHVTPAGSEAAARRADVAVLPPAERPRRSWRAVRRPEPRRLDRLAVLFTDLVGSTELLDRLGDEQAHELRRCHFELLRGAVRDHGGNEVKSLGDGLMVVFESPPAAASCALAMQRAVASCEDPLRLRVGIATGEVVCEDDDYFGRPVIVARRLCDAAQGGDVLISGAARGLMADSATQRQELAPLALKGLSEPVTPTLLRAHRPVAVA